MHDNLAELIIWCVALACATLLTLRGFLEFKPVVLGLLTVVSARGIRAALRPREVVREIRDAAKAAEPENDPQKR